jgi:hypothetical protein
MGLEPEQRLFDEDVTCDFFLRIAQFRVAAAAGRQEEALIIVSALRCASMALPTRSNECTALACSIVLGTPEIRLPIELYCDLLLQLADLAADDSITTSIPPLAAFKSIARDMNAVQTLFYMANTHISSVCDLVHMLNRLDQADYEVKSNLLIVFQKDPHHAGMLVATSWLREAERETLDPAALDGALVRVGEFGRAWGVPTLAAAAVVARSVIADEYGKDSDHALRIVEAELSEKGPIGVLLAQRFKVLFHSKQITEAMVAARDAVPYERELSDVEASFFFRLAGIVEAQSDSWSEAENRFLRGAARAGRATVQQPMALGLKADAGFARWKQGKYAESLMVFAEVLDGLATVDANAGLRERYVHATVGHALAWMNADAAGVSRGMTDITYEPPPGFCSNQEPSEQLKEHAIPGLPAVWGVLGSIEASLGLSLGLMDRARREAVAGLPMLIETEMRRARFEGLWRKDGLDDLVPASVELLAGLIAQRAARQEGHDLLKIGPVPTLSATHWQGAGNRDALLLIVLAAAVVLTARFPDSPLPVELWRRDLCAAGVDSADLERFFSALGGGPREAADNLVESAAAAVAVLRRPAADLRDAVRACFWLLQALGSADWGRFAAEGVASVATRFWAHAVDSQSFSFRAPVVSCPLLRERIDDPSKAGLAKAAAVVEAAADALGMRLDPTARQMLRILGDGRMLHEKIDELPSN